MTQNLGSTSNPLSMTGEQWVLEERTDDPLSPDPGECWIRTDLNAGDKIATLKFGDGSEVPIFPTGTSEPEVLEVRRVQTGGQTGYLPVADLDFATFPQLRLQHNNTVYALHDDIEPGAIPDSEADQKLVHRWYLSEDSDPFVDQVGNDDGTNFGTTQVTGDWVDDAARIGDGTDDYIETTKWDDFGSAMDSDFAIAFSIDTTDDEAYIGGYLGDDQFFSFQIGNFTDSGQPSLRISDNNNTELRIGGKMVVNDGNPHRIVLNKTGNTSSDIDWYVDGEAVSSDVTRDEGTLSDFINFEYPFPFFARNFRGSIDSNIDAVIDDFCVFDDSLTSAEATSYYSPWP